ncbi:MAG: ankyrin repeat domain-containing protein [Candidatus Babeliales bacterium]
MITTKNFFVIFQFLFICNLYAMQWPKNYQELQEICLNINNPDAMDSLGKTLLNKTIDCDFFALTENLLQKGANPNIPNNDKDENCPLHSLITPRDNTPKTSKERLLYFLHYYGANQNIRNKVGFTPLHIAVYFNDITNTQNLLEYNPNLSIQDNLGDTPLHLALQLKRVHILPYLLKKIQKNNQTYLLNIKNESNQTAISLAKAQHLTFAFEKNNHLYEIVKQNKHHIIANNIALFKTMDSTLVQTILIFTFHYGSLAFFEDLLKLGLDVKIKDNKGNSLLHEAVCADRFDLVEYLYFLDNDLMHTMNAENKIPFDLAQSSKMRTFLINLCNNNTVNSNIFFADEKSEQPENFSYDELTHEILNNKCDTYLSI